MIRMTVLLVLLSAANAAHAAEPNRPVPAVDLARYAGTWHEQARLPMFFQRKCARDTTATYTQRADGGIDVLNRCITADGGVLAARGVARGVGGSTSQLQVRFAPAALSFLPFVWGDYWIVGLDGDYRWAMVGSPSRRTLWILTRDRVIDRPLRDRLVERGRAMGYPVDTLLFAPPP